LTPKLDQFSQENLWPGDQWIYWVEEIGPSGAGCERLRLSDINKALNESGRLGWELIGIIQSQPQELLAFYKRKIII
jgi:hypothetical protein